MKRCALCGSTTAIHSHHVLGRVGKDKNKPFNLIDLCAQHHRMWHEHRTPDLEDAIYRIMKERHGDLFPMKVNGKPYRTKWLLLAEGRANDRLYPDSDIVTP